MNYAIFSTIIDYLSIGELETLRRTNFIYDDYLNSKEIFNRLSYKEGLDNVNSFNEIFSKYNRVSDIINAIDADNEEYLDLLIIDKTVDLHYILIYCVLCNSINCFEMLTPYLTNQLNQIHDVCKIRDEYSEVTIYLEELIPVVLASKDIDFYISFFEAINNTNEEFAEVIDYVPLVKISYLYGWSYEHGLLTGNYEMYELMKTYLKDADIKDRQIDKELLRVAVYINSPLLVKYIMNNGPHKNVNFFLVGDNEAESYYFGRVSLDKALTSKAESEREYKDKIQNKIDYKHLNLTCIEEPEYSTNSSEESDSDYMFENYHFL